jgi:protein-S-isoprenylcysteine O-methyltransferase Ste14
MTPLPFRWSYALPFWAIFVWAFLPEFRIVRRASREQTASDSRSLQVIMMGQMVATFLAFYLAPNPRWRMPVRYQLVALLAGMALLVAGSLLRRHCWRMLGSSFTGDVRASADQVVVDRGAYRYLRHPSYTAGTLMNLGIGVALGSWMSVVLITAGSLLVYSYRIAIEERTLLAVIGEPYRTFAEGRKRMIPFLY